MPWPRCRENPVCERYRNTFRKEGTKADGDVIRVSPCPREELGDCGQLFGRFRAYLHWLWRDMPGL